jgi:titin
MNTHRLWTAGLILALVLALWPAHTARATTYNVTNTDDDGDGSLRRAIQQANSSDGPDTIHFSIGGAGVHVIQPAAALPTLTDDGTVIDGYSQSGSAPATGTTAATILIEIDGSLVPFNNGLNITSSGNVIQGLAINRFPLNGIAIGGATATDNRVAGNHIGTDAAGDDDLGNGLDGVFIGYGATRNTVGGDEPAERNVISGNGWDGVALYASGTHTNTVTGNYLGLAANGTDALGNSYHGVYIYGGAHHNTIGPNNAISGNGQDGVYVYGTGTMNNTITGNYIGTESTGSHHLENFLAGVTIRDGAQQNTVGQGNVISGNRLDGVSIQGTGTAGNVVIGNLIGTDSTGVAEVMNHDHGVLIRDGAQNNTVGGDTAAERNVISANHSTGVCIAEANTTGNVVSGNYIGVNASGSIALANTGPGVYIGLGAQNNRIGGEALPEMNVISGNQGDGVRIEGAGTTGNVVSGNSIGSDANATADLGNLGNGVTIRGGAQNNLIGGDVFSEANFIAYNPYGVMIYEAGTNGNTVSGNGIGAADFGGVYITVGAQYNTIGPLNVIAQNPRNGVFVEGAAARGNVVTHNSIYANGGRGIQLEGGANNNMPKPGIINMTLTGGAVNLVGKACVVCTVEVFVNHDNDGEGESYLGTTVADGGGLFTITVGSLFHVYLTVTNTRAGDGTSEFSGVYTSTLQALLLPTILKSP